MYIRSISPPLSSEETFRQLQLADIFTKELAKILLKSIGNKPGITEFQTPAWEGVFNSKNLNMTPLWIKFRAIKAHMIGFCISLNNKLVVKIKKEIPLLFYCRILATFKDRVFQFDLHETDLHRSENPRKLRWHSAANTTNTTCSCTVLR